MVSQFIVKSTLLGAVSAAAIGLATPTIAQTQNAQAEVKFIQIEAQALSDALLDFSDEYGINVSFNSDVTSGKRTKAVSGRFGPEDALGRILGGTGLKAVSSGNGAFVIAQQSVGNESGAVEQSPLQVAEVIEVQGKFQQSLVDRLPISPKELPFVLNTIGRDEIDKRSFIRPIDILDTLPNVQISIDSLGGGTPIFLVRGFDAPVLVDNRLVPSDGQLAQPDNSFVERYEVLKGPASIALGPVAGGGVINTVTKIPEGTDFTEFAVSTDQFGTVNAQFDWNDDMFLGRDGVGLRVSGAYRDFNFDPEEQDREEVAIRPVVVLDLGSSTSIKASLAYRALEIVPNVGFPLFSDGSVPDEFDTDTFFGLATADIETEDVLFDAQVTHNFLDNLRLVARGAFQSTSIDAVDRNGIYNYTYDDGGPGASRNNPIFYTYSQTNENDTDALFIDAQILYTIDLFGNESNIVVGGSYRDDETTNVQSFFGQVGPFAFSDIDEPRFGVVGQRDPAFQRDQVFTEELLSFYTELALRPTSWLTVVAGARYDDLETSSIDFAANTPELSTSEEDATTFRIGVSAELLPSLTVFAGYAEAFVPQSRIRSNNEPVGPEISTNYEIGLKGSFFDGLASFSASIFRTDRSNVAVDDPEFIDGFFRPFAVTIDAQRNEGFEFTGAIKPIDGWSITANYGYLNQSLLENTADVFFVPFPENQFSIFSDYTVQSGPIEGLTVGGGMRYFDTRISVVDTFNFPSVTLFDGFVKYNVNEKTSVQLNVLNLTDKQYLETGGSTDGALGGQQQFGTPRTFVLTFNLTL